MRHEVYVKVERWGVKVSPVPRQRKQRQTRDIAKAVDTIQIRRCSHPELLVILVNKAVEKLSSRDRGRGIRKGVKVIPFTLKDAKQYLGPNGEGYVTSVLIRTHRGSQRIPIGLMWGRQSNRDSYLWVFEYNSRYKLDARSVIGSRLPSSKATSPSGVTSAQSTQLNGRRTSKQTSRPDRNSGPRPSLPTLPLAIR